MADTSTGLIHHAVTMITKLLTGIRNVLGVLLMSVILLLIVFAITDNNLQSVPEKGALYLAPQGYLVDQKTYSDPLNQIFVQSGQRDSETLVRDVVEAIDTALDDSRITHLLLDTDYLAGGGMSKLEEIGNALKRFRNQKPIIAVGDSFMASQYYLAAHANEIMLNPMGEVMINGLSSYRNYFKDGLDKLKITMNIFRAGQYKSAVEPLLRNSMSEEVKEETQLLLGDLWQFYTSEIEFLRSLDEGTIDKYASTMHVAMRAHDGDTAKVAEVFGLIDVIASRTEIYEYLNEIIPGSDGEFNSIGMDSYLANTRNLSEHLTAGQDQIAVVIASGTIMDGQQPEGSIGGDTLAEIFQNLKDNENVKAIVLRIDSGGGSAFASEIIRDSINAIKNKGVPIIVSMSSVAASGGYWIAAEADHILAMSTSVTGSIGVWGVIPDLSNSLANLGIYSDGVSTSQSAFRAQIQQPLSQSSKEIIQASVDGIYSRFLDLVASGRNSTQEEIHQIAQGRVWTGTQALENGLVDELGDLNDAVDVAAEIAGLQDYKVIYPRKELTPFETILSELIVRAKTVNLDAKIDSSEDLGLFKGLQFYASELFQPLKMMNSFNDPKGIYLYCDKCFL
jgi:protease-4